MADERAFDAVLCDFDGVLRRHDDAAVEQLEGKYGVPPGTLLATAMAEELLRPAILGEVSDDEWRRNVAVQLLPEYCIEVATDLVADWSGLVGAVDPQVRALLAEVRAAGVRVVLMSNATTRLEDELEVLGIAGDIDIVVSSARLGVAKPEPAAYFAAAQLAEADVTRCLFVDDAAINVEVAQAVGMQGHVYTGADELRTALELS
ncbi:MAG: HAD-IA family hydrolase [Streptosporangiales bacterium]|nr:HAD-IA family hydrolase [Streptosporangiales bacterium]